jgi:hypothetical protein
MQVSTWAVVNTAGRCGGDLPSLYDASARIISNDSTCPAEPVQLNFSIELHLGRPINCWK